MVYFIPTPIGNLEDISQRSLNLLCEIDTLFCEDTRITKKLINLLNQKYNLNIEISKYISLHSHNEKSVLNSIDLTLFDRDVAYLSDAGMPCISDPGSYFIKFCQKNCIDYEVLSGANAALLAFASSGFESSKFLFYGFLPHKGRDRQSALNEIANSKYPIIIYESPHRIEKLIDELEKLIPQREVFFIKEATKKYEKKFKCLASEIRSQIEGLSLKGEWSVVVEGSLDCSGEEISKDDIISLEIAPKQKAKLLSKLTGKSIKYWYDHLCINNSYIE